MANRRHVFFSALAPETSNKQKTKFILTCNVQKVIRALEVVKNSAIHFFFKIFGIV